MTDPLSDRALIVGERLFGLGELDRGSGALGVRIWTEAPDGAIVRRDSEIPPNGLARGPGEGPEDGAVAIFFDATLSPYRFGLHVYDPPESLGASLDAAAKRGGSLALAVWAAMESDLFRFAFDGEFTAALGEYRDSDEWRRFASLNDLYRASIRAIAPFGAVPPEWNAWLREDDVDRARPTDRATGRSMTSLLARLLTRPVVGIAPALRRSSGPNNVFSAARVVTS